jgi:diguanylate cyclase (GGDEF)-like protein
MHHSSASIGVNLFTGEEKTQDELLKEADTAMYTAKRAGGNRVEFFDQTNNSLSRADNRDRRQG